MRTRALRTAGLLFALSLALTACDPTDFFGFLGGGGTDAPPAEEPAVPEPDPVSNDSDPVSDESDPVSDESDPVSDESDPVADDEDDGRKVDCFRNRGEAEAAAEDAGDAEDDAAADTEA